MQEHKEKVTVIIVDDEELARRMIREYMAPFKSIELLAECATGENAVKTINDLRPDLIFLDIQMPGLTGFEVLTRLDRIPFIIFSTAYDKYALQAFEVNAIDYLLKPYDRSRFEKALKRALERLERKGDGESDRILALLHSLQQETKSSDRFWVKEAGTLHPVRYEEIDWIAAMDDYACLHVGKMNFLVSQTMQDLETILDEKMFMRIHRSTIVNLDRIKELRSMGDGSYEVILKDGTKLSLSRGKAKQLRGMIL